MVREDDRWEELLAVAVEDKDVDGFGGVESIGCCCDACCSSTGDVEINVLLIDDDDDDDDDSFDSRVILSSLWLDSDKRFKFA